MSGKKVAGVAVAGLLGLSLVGCSPQPTEMQQALCTDLDNGLSLLQVAQGTADYFENDILRFALYAKDAMEIGCPSYLEDYAEFFNFQGIELD